SRIISRDRWRTTRRLQGGTWAPSRWKRRPCEGVIQADRGCHRQEAIRELMCRRTVWPVCSKNHLGLSVRTLRSSDGDAGGLLRGHPYLCAVATLLCALALLAPAAAGTRDLVVYGEPTLEKALKSVGSLWQARTGTRVNVFVAPTDLSYAQ